MIEEYSETGKLEEGGMNMLERELSKHIKEKINISHEKIVAQLGEDDIIDYLLMLILLSVAGVGLYMWRKVKQQEKQYIL